MHWGALAAHPAHPASGRPCPPALLLLRALPRATFCSHQGLLPPQRPAKPLRSPEAGGAATGHRESPAPASQDARWLQGGRSHWLWLAPGSQSPEPQWWTSSRILPASDRRPRGSALGPQHLLPPYAPAGQLLKPSPSCTLEPNLLVTQSPRFCTGTHPALLPTWQPLNS